MATLGHGGAQGPDVTRIPPLSARSSSVGRSPTVSRNESRLLCFPSNGWLAGKEQNHIYNGYINVKCINVKYIQVSHIIYR